MPWSWSWAWLFWQPLLPSAFGSLVLLGLVQLSGAPSSHSVIKYVAQCGGYESYDPCDRPCCFFTKSIARPIPNAPDLARSYICPTIAQACTCYCCVLAYLFACLLKLVLGPARHPPWARCAGRWPIPLSSCTAGPWKMVCWAIFQHSMQGRWRVEHAGQMAGCAIFLHSRPKEGVRLFLCGVHVRMYSWFCVNVHVACALSLRTERIQMMWDTFNGELLSTA